MTIPNILETMLLFRSTIEEYQIDYIHPTLEEELSQKEIREKERIREEVEWGVGKC